MRWDSPAKDGAASHENLGGPSTTTATATAGGAEGEGRKFAGGAVSRVRKKRQKEWRRKKQDSESEDDGEVSEKLGEWIARKARLETLLGMSADLVRRAERSSLDVPTARAARKVPERPNTLTISTSLRPVCAIPRSQRSWWGTSNLPLIRSSLISPQIPSVLRQRRSGRLRAVPRGAVRAHCPTRCQGAHARGLGRYVCGFVACLIRFFRFFSLTIPRDPAGDRGMYKAVSDQPVRPCVASTSNVSVPYHRGLCTR